MSRKHRVLSRPHIVWVYDGPIASNLDSATWLKTVSELRALGWPVTLVAQGPAGPQCIQGVEVWCLPKPDVYLLGYCWFQVRLGCFLANNLNGIDVLLLHEMSALWLLPVRLMRRLRGRNRPVLLVDTRTLPMEMATWRGWLRGRFHNVMSRLASRWADGRTAITQRIAESLRIPPRKLWGTWPSGVDLELFAPAQRVRQWPSADEPIHLIYVGALHQERNLMSLCQAVEEANANGVRFYLSLAGRGSEESALLEFAQQTGGRIRVLSPVPHVEVPDLLAQAHVGVLPFPDEEQFRVSSPIKLFEYLGAGMPILATRIACHTDVVGNGGYVFWAEEATVEGLLTALHQIWCRRASLGEMGLGAAAAVRDWTWQASALKLCRALERGLLDTSQGAPAQCL